MRPKLTDTERLDALQKLLGSYTGKVICRWSATGRGWRLHETNKAGGFPNVRKAIDEFLYQNAGRVSMTREQWLQKGV